MSTTAGPTVPDSTGKVTGVVPSENFRLAVRSLIVVPSRRSFACGLRPGAGPGWSFRGARAAPSDRAQTLDQRTQALFGLASAGDQVPQRLVRQVEQRVEVALVVVGQP